MKNPILKTLRNAFLSAAVILPGFAAASPAEAQQYRGYQPQATNQLILTCEAQRPTYTQNLRHQAQRRAINRGSRAARGALPRSGIGRDLGQVFIRVTQQQLNQSNRNYYNQIIWQGRMQYATCMDGVNHMVQDLRRQCPQGVTARRYGSIRNGTQIVVNAPSRCNFNFR